ncbi:MAG: zinc-binding dehydrogenase [Lachnospiraceae bacterium]|nr:zinc-binding dehydrogenase [Lachnospiraceae bacterium]
MATKIRPNRFVSITGVDQLEVGEAFPLPEKPLSKGAIIKPVIWSICTSDVEGLRMGWANRPHLLGKPTGHEMCGIVEAVGEEVEDFKPGERVVVCTKMPNWRSLEAQDGYYRGNTDNMFWHDPGPLRGGCFVEHFNMSDADMNLAHIPDDVSWEDAVMCTDMMETSFGAVEEMNIRFGDSVAVLGIGPVGQMAVAACALRGAGRIFAVGSRQVCFDCAKKFGATHCHDYHDKDYPDKIIEENRGRDLDAAIVCGGSTEQINIAMRLIKRGGTVMNICKFNNEPYFQMNMSYISGGTGGKRLLTESAAGGRVFMYRMLKMIQYDRIHPSQMITHSFHGIDRIPEAMELYANLDRSLIKAVVYND